MINEQYSATTSIVEGNPLWPLMLFRASTADRPDIASFQLTNLLRGLSNYDAEIAKTPFARADDLLKAGGLPKSLGSLISSIYEEGAALAEVFGNALPEAKLGMTDRLTVEAQIKRFGSLENWMGFQHVKEFVEAAQQQARLDLLRETGKLDTEAFKVGLGETIHRLRASGHMGVHELVSAKPSIARFLEQDVRPIDVIRSNGKITHGIDSISRFSRAAYLNQERAWSEQIGSASYHADSYFHAIGKKYCSAFVEKWNQIRSLGAEYNVTRRFEHGKTEAAEFVGKHALVLADPGISKELGASQALDPALLDGIAGDAQKYGRMSPTHRNPEHGNGGLHNAERPAKIVRTKPAAAGSMAGGISHKGLRVAVSIGLAGMIAEGVANWRTEPDTPLGSANSRSEVRFGKVLQVTLGSAALAATWMIGGGRAR